MPARTRYPDTPAGHARAMRDGDVRDLERLGHRVKWTRGHGLRGAKGAPGYTGRCELCGGVVRVAYLGDGVGQRTYEAPMAKKFMYGPRRCTRGR